MSAHGGSNSWNLSPSAIAGERQKAASGPLWPACGRPGPARRSSSGPHFACGAGAPPEVPGGGTTFGKNGHMAMMGELDSWPLKVLALVFGDQSKLLAALCVAKDLVRGHAYS